MHDYHLKFRLPDRYNQHQLINELAGHYSIKSERPVAVNISIYDTFDWRLFNKSLVLYKLENRLYLRKLFQNAVIHSTSIPSSPVFIWNFPSGKLKEHLAPIIKMRALFKLADVHCRSTAHRILNKDEKTVASLIYEKIRPSAGKDVPILATYLWLQPVKGYPKFSRNLAKHLKGAGFRQVKKEDIYFKTLDAVDKHPGSYSSKLNIQLDPDMRSDEATRIILRYLLQVMKINEGHIAEDLDIEFLHDFRVAVRRTRSALGQIKSVFAQKTTNRFKKDFAFVGKLSNQLRDLDVYLLKEETYKMMLPPALRDDIVPLFERFREKRLKALQKVVTGLKSKKYLQIMQTWEDFLNEPLSDLPATSNAGLPIIHLAQKRIYKQYRRIVKDGNRILENTEDEKLHALRIECKKQRYLMEFFSSLFPRKKINILIDQLKKLQDNLGDFNDLCAQEEYLLSITAELPSDDQKSKKTLVAIGSMIGTLGREKQIFKDAFAKTFSDYASVSNKGAFRNLFSSKSKKAIS